MGVRFKSDEIIVGTEHGVLRARTIKRLTVDQQWDREFVRNIQGTPRQPDPKVVLDQIHASPRLANVVNLTMDQEEQDFGNLQLHRQSHRRPRR